MYRFGFIVLVILTRIGPADGGSRPVSLDSATHYYLELFVRTSTDRSTDYTKLNVLFEKLQAKKSVSKSETDFLRTLFYKTHQMVLKQYVDFAPFHKLLDEGKYNCLTGTALYGLLLHRFGYEFRIIETNYHIFLLVKTDDQDFLFEATDPLNGFVSDDNEIRQKIADYKSQTTLRTDAQGRTYYQYSIELFNQVSLQQLPGLLYYNESVDAYNRKDLLNSVTLLEAASKVYTSERTEEFCRVLLVSLAESSLSEPEKQVYTQRVLSIRKKSLAEYQARLSN